MATLETTPPSGHLLSAPYTFHIRVSGVNFAVLNKILLVTSGPNHVYSWSEGAITVGPGYAQQTTQGADYLEAAVTVLGVPVAGDVVNFVASYSDDATPVLGTSAEYCYGNVVFLARGPAPNQVGAPVGAPLAFVVRPDSALAVDGFDLYVNGVPATVPDTSEFVRPDFVGSSAYSGGVYSVRVQPRRSFSAGSVVEVRWLARVRPISKQPFLFDARWSFYTAPRAARLRQSALSRAGLDTPSPRGVVEIFRQAAMDALLVPDSSAGAEVVFFYAVQQSSLATLASRLPGARSLAAETPQLLSGDIASTLDAANKLSRVEMFWPAMLQVLVQDTGVPREVAALLSRAWDAEQPQDKVAATAAALLYATATSI